MSKSRNITFQTLYNDMDQQFKANSRLSNRVNQDGGQNVFVRYNNGNQNSRRQADISPNSGDMQRRTNSQVNQPSYGQSLKKMKYNQMEALRELRQEYQILRNIPLQDQFIGRSHVKKQSSEYLSSHAEQESISSYSKQSDRRKPKQSHSQAKDTHMLSYQKRQLELIIGNSMRKIEELLNNQIQYKKIIHELQMQLDTKSNDEKLQNLAKTMKKNEKQLNQRVQSSKRDIQRLKQINIQLQNRNDSLQIQIDKRNQDLRKYRDEKRALQENLRLQKDKYLNLQIDVKRLKMEKQILEKDKNIQINRLKQLLQSQNKEILLPNNSQIRKLEDELKSSKYKYDMLSNQFEKYKHQTFQKTKQASQGQNQQHLKQFQSLLKHLKEEAVNQNRASIDLISSMVAKFEEKNEREKEKQRERKQKEKQFERQRSKQKEMERLRLKQKQQERQRQKERERRRQSKSPKTIQDPNANKLLEELYNLRNEVSTLKRDKDDLNKSSRMFNLGESMADYQSKIRKLEQEITDGTITKERLLKQYEIIKASYEFAKQEIQRLKLENQKLRERLNQTQQNGHLSNQHVRISFREKEEDYEQSIRQLKRQLDEALFLVDKAKKEGEFNLELLRGQQQTNLRLSKQQLSRVENEREILRAEFNKMKSYYEAKIQEKNALLQKTAQEFAILCENKQKYLVAYKANSQREMNEVIRKIEGMAQLNERYLKQSTQLSSYERELNELRYAVKRMKGINQGLNHLWQIKQTEYYNLNDILRQLKAQ